MHACLPVCVCVCVWMYRCLSMRLLASLCVCMCVYADEYLRYVVYLWVLGTWGSSSTWGIQLDDAPEWFTNTEAIYKKGLSRLCFFIQCLPQDALTCFISLLLRALSSTLWCAGVKASKLRLNKLVCHLAPSSWRKAGLSLDPRRSHWRRWRRTDCYRQSWITPPTPLHSM